MDRVFRASDRETCHPAIRKQHLPNEQAHHPVEIEPSAADLESKKLVQHFQIGGDLDIFVLKEGANDPFRPNPRTIHHPLSTMPDRDLFMRVFLPQ